MSATQRVRALLDPLLEDLGVDLWDLELAGGVLRVTVDRPGGVGIDDIARLTRALSHALDDADPVAGSYTLEVSSPGLERTLRTPEHFRASIGSTVAIKTVAGTEGDRRVRGVLTAADDDGCTVRLAADDPSAAPADALDPERTLPYAAIERARTVFEWGPGPKPTKVGHGPGGRSSGASSEPTKRKKAATP